MHWTDSLKWRLRPNSTEILRDLQCRREYRAHALVLRDARLRRALRMRASRGPPPLTPRRGLQDNDATNTAASRQKNARGRLAQTARVEEMAGGSGKAPPCN